MITDSMFPNRVVTSLTATSSPETNTTGTPIAPAYAAFNSASVTEVPFRATRVKCALEMVWARTPFGFVVDA